MAIGYTMLYYGYILWLYTMVIYYGYILWLYMGYTMVLNIQLQLKKCTSSRQTQKITVGLTWLFAKHFTWKAMFFRVVKCTKICIGSIHFWFFIRWCSIIKDCFVSDFWNKMVGLSWFQCRWFPSMLVLQHTSPSKHDFKAPLHDFIASSPTSTIHRLASEIQTASDHCYVTNVVYNQLGICISI